MKHTESDIQILVIKLTFIWIFDGNCKILQTNNNKYFQFTWLILFLYLIYIYTYMYYIFVINKQNIKQIDEDKDYKSSQCIKKRYINNTSWTLNL